MKILCVAPSNPWCLKGIGLNEGFVYSCSDFLTGAHVNDCLNYFTEDGFIDFHEDFNFSPLVLRFGKNLNFSYQKTEFKNKNELCLLLAYNRSSEDEILIVKKDDPLLNKIDFFINENTDRYDIWLFGYLFNYLYNDINHSDHLRLWSPQNIVGTGLCTYVITGSDKVLSEVRSKICDYPSMPEVQLGFPYETSTDFFDIIKNSNLEWIESF